MHYYSLIFVFFLSIIIVDSKHKHGPKGGAEFLKNVTADARKEFQNISKNPGISIQQKEDKLKEWAKENNVEAQFNEHLTNMTQHKEQLNKNVGVVVSRLSEAKIEVDKIFADKSMTKIQQHDAVEELRKKKYPKEIPTLFYIGKLFTEDGKKEEKHTKRRN